MIDRLALLLLIFMALLFPLGAYAQQQRFSEDMDRSGKQQISNGEESEKVEQKVQDHSEKGQREDREVPAAGFQRLGYDLQYLFLSPTRIDKEDIPKILFFAGTTALLYAAREDIRETILDNTTKSRKKLYDSARISGKGAFAPGLALLFFTVGQFRDDDYELETAQIILESAAMSAIAAAAGSFIISTERPRDGDDGYFFQSGGHGVSLDVALSSSFVFPIIDRYLKIGAHDSGAKKTFKYLAKVFIFSLPILTALQRMSSDSHWAPDVFLGAATGLTIGKILTNAHQPKKHGSLSISLSGGMLRLQF